MSNHEPTVPATLPFTLGESLMWHAQADPSLQFRIMGIVSLDQEPDRVLLFDRIDRLTRIVPRMRHRIIANPIPGLRPHWELDPHFDLDFHLRSVPVAAHSDDSEVLRLAALARQDEFAAEHSPWRMILVTGLPEGRAALIIAMNHVMTDGIGAVKMASLLFDLDEAGPSAEDLDDLPLVPPATLRSTARRALTGITQEVDQVAVLKGLVRGAAHSVRDPRAAGRSLFDATAAAARLADPTTQPGSPLPRTMSSRDQFLTLEVPVDRLKGAGRAAGAKLNDAYLAALVGGLKRYHQLHNLPLQTLEVSIPVNMRQEDSNHGGNEILLKICTLPADIVDPGKRIESISSIARQELTSGSHLFSAALTHALGRLPGTLTRTAVGVLADGLDISTTNVPGVPVQLFLAGAPVGAMNAFISRGRSPMTAALISYNGTAHISLAIDPVAIPDGDVLAASIQSELDAVMDLADAS